MNINRTKVRPFSIEVRRAPESGRQDPTCVILDLHGEIDGFANPLLQQTFAGEIRQKPERVLLNFGDVDYINSTGIALIVALLAEARRSNTTVVAYGLSEHYLDIFRITRLVDFMNVSEDEAAALAGNTLTA